MEAAKNLYLKIGQALENSEESQMFGKPCFKINKKAYVSFFQDEMVFKLKDEVHAEALGLDSAQLFDPSGKGRAMKEWVQVPFKHKAKWPVYAEEALKYALSLQKSNKKK